MIVPSWLVQVLAWAPAMEMQADKAKEVPGIFKVLLPFLLFGVFASVAAITFFTIIDVFRKRVRMETVEEGNVPPLASGEMTKYERQSRIAPALGKVLAVFFIVGLILFMLGGLYTMGRGAGTTEQLRKEGAARQQALEKRKASIEAGGSGDFVVGEDGEKKTGTGFETDLDAMK